MTFARPDFAVCLEPGGDSIWQVVAAAAPLITFSHRADIKPRTVALDRDLETWLGDSDRAPLALGMSPFYGVAVATWLGFWTVGLVGVDLTHDRFPHLEDIEAKWERLLELAARAGTRVVNLSERSRLKAVEHGDWHEIRTKARLRCDRDHLPGAPEGGVGDLSAPAGAAGSSA